MEFRANFWFVVPAFRLLCVRVPGLIMAEMADITLDTSRTRSFLFEVVGLSQILKQTKAAIYAAWGVSDPGHRDVNRRSYIRDRMSYAKSPGAAGISQISKAKPYTRDTT